PGEKASFVDGRPRRFVTLESKSQEVLKLVELIRQRDSEPSDAAGQPKTRDSGPMIRGILVFTVLSGLGAAVASAATGVTGVFGTMLTAKWIAGLASIGLGLLWFACIVGGFFVLITGMASYQPRNENDEKPWKTLG